MGANGVVTKTFFNMRRIFRKIWVRISTFAVLALMTAFLSHSVSSFMPDKLVKFVDTDAVLKILTVLSSSMLAVTTFSLSVMVSARQAITSNITPRAHSVVAQSSVTQNVLATFLGAFVYAVTAQILIEIGLYEARASSVILIVSLVVLLLVVVAMMRWIEHLTAMGSIPDTVRELEDDCAGAVLNWRTRPALGAVPADASVFAASGAGGLVKADQTGYVQHIDFNALNSLAEASGAAVYIEAHPGRFVATGAPLCRHTGPLDAADIRAAFTIDQTRSYDQDARFGLIVLAEIAQRALSPAVNDPGTAIFIIGRLTHLLVAASRRDEDDREEMEELPQFGSVYMTPVSAADLINDSFTPIMRDGAGLIEIQIRIQKSLRMIASLGSADMAEAAEAAGRRALEEADQGLVLKSDRDSIHRLNARLWPEAAPVEAS